MFKPFLLPLSIVVLMTGFLFLAAACETEPAPTDTPAPTATPVPTPTPELTLEDLLVSVREKLSSMSTARFQMIDELESGSKFFGNTLKSIEGDIKSPDSFRMLVDVVAPGFGFVQIEMMAIGDQAFMKFAKDAPWAPLPLDQVPFNFGGIGTTLSDLVPVIKDLSIAGTETLEGAVAIRLDGTVTSEDLLSLITSADPGYAVALSFWVDEADHTLRQIRIAGQIFDDDAPETTRLLIIDRINDPVDIQLPDIASGQ